MKILFKKKVCGSQGQCTDPLGKLKCASKKKNADVDAQLISCIQTLHSCAFANSWNYISAMLGLFLGLTTLFMGPPNSTKCAYSCIFGPTALFTPLKIILLQYFQ